jgi:DsbC/DsbD-like thiol-disulfide interchange protein
MGKTRRCTLGLPHFRSLTFALMLFTGANAQAAGAAIPHGTVELVAENQWIAAGHALSLGLHFQLEKGWHIYWVNPGDSGEPPRVKWQLPAGLTVGAMEWPAPRRLGTSSIVDFGYEDAVTLIVPLRTAANLTTQQPAQLAAEVSVLVCRELCIPGKAQISLTLPIKSQPAVPDVHAQDLFIVARKLLPRPVPKNWNISVAEANGSFVLTANLGQQVTQATFFPLAESQIDNAAPQNFQPGAGGFRLTLLKSEQLRKPLARLTGVLVLPDAHAYLIDVPLSKSAIAKNVHSNFHATLFSKEEL